MSDEATSKIDESPFQKLWIEFQDVAKKFAQEKGFHTCIWGAKTTPGLFFLSVDDYDSEYDENYIDRIIYIFHKDHLDKWIVSDPIKERYKNE